MNINSYTVEQIKDPTGILSGLRYEFFLSLEVDEEDELYSEAGIEIRAIIGKKENEFRLVNYFIIDKKDNEYVDFALEEDEEEMILAFCREEILKEEV